MPAKVLHISEKTTALPVIHGSGDFALETRRFLLDHPFDCVAVPLPPSFQGEVESAIGCLPSPSMVIQGAETRYGGAGEWTPENDLDDIHDDDAPKIVSYVPIDACQSVIAALRIALEERIAREFIDLETVLYEPISLPLPDAYALKKAPLERFVSAIAPAVGRLPEGQPQDRVAHMAGRIHQLEEHYDRILLVCSILEWPWIREAYTERRPALAEHEDVAEPECFEVDEQSLLFLLGELPFISGLYEKARREWEDDDNLSVDGVKELLLVAREAYRNDFRGRARTITPHRLGQCLKYIRNLSLIESRLTPDLYTIVMAAKQTAGDQLAMHVAETAAKYPYVESHGRRQVKLGVKQARLPDDTLVLLENRLPGPPVIWRSCELKRKPDSREKEKWRTRWNPYSQCSWPPEDQLIENFRSHVFDRAKKIMGADLVKTEKFSTSIKDGIDIRDTLRHWYEGDIYVKVLPPSRGALDCTVMLFDSPAEPQTYPWRSTWFAEFDWESTLAFYATDYRNEMVGPGIAMSTYGGAMFLYPPLMISDIWRDPRLDFTETLEERLLAGACLYSRCKQIALLSHLPPGAGWRRLAKRFGKSWIHLPLAQFSDETVQQLRMMHVLNGKEVRSFASEFIRRA
jgi:hypothetical protein